MATDTGFPFLLLPAELRNITYRQLFGGQTVVCCPTFYYGAPIPAICMTSHSLHRESLDAYRCYCIFENVLSLITPSTYIWRDRHAINAVRLLNLKIHVRDLLYTGLDAQTLEWGLRRRLSYLPLVTSILAEASISFCKTAKGPFLWHDWINGPSISKVETMRVLASNAKLVGIKLQFEISMWELCYRETARFRLKWTSEDSFDFEFIKFTKDFRACSPIVGILSDLGLDLEDDVLQRQIARLGVEFKRTSIPRAAWIAM